MSTLRASQLVLAKNADAGGGHELATVPAGRRWIIRDIHLVCTTAAPASKASVSMHDSGATIWVAISDGALDVNTVRSHACDVVLNAGDVLYLYSVGGGVACVVSGHDLEVWD